MELKKSVAETGDRGVEPSPLQSLHRYFIWANRMRTHFDEILSRGGYDEKIEFESWLYMSYWYGGLYVVIEGWRKLQLTDTVIDNLLLHPYVDLLRLYRNGTFHFHQDYHDKKFISFMKEGGDSAAWIRDLNEQFGRYFLKENR